MDLREIAALQQERAGLTAAAGPPLVPPREWFEMEEPEGPVGWTVTADGQVFGHAATWGTCHTGKPGRCITPPKSRSDYAYYKTGLTEVDDGELLPTGRITLGTGHASLQASPAATAEHYDHTGAVVADVNVRDGEHGIWVTGAIRPDVPPERIRTLRGASLSGDWRSIRGALEMLGLLAVNVPGFPVPRGQALTADGRYEMYEEALEANDEILALVAAGTFEVEAPPAPEELAMIEPTEAQWEDAIAELSAAAAYSPKALTRKDKVKEAMGCMRAAAALPAEPVAVLRVVDQETGEDVTDQYIVAAAKPKKKFAGEHGDEKLENLDEEPDQDEPDTEEPDDSEPDQDVDDSEEPDDSEPDADEDDADTKAKKKARADKLAAAGFIYPEGSLVSLDGELGIVRDSGLTAIEECEECDEDDLAMDDAFVAALIEELDPEFADDLVAAGNPGRKRARKIAKVMREFKAGKLKTNGGVVTSRKQALAIALRESQNLTSSGEFDPLSLPAVARTAQERLSGGLLLAASFTTPQREKLAEKGKAMPDGSFPIRNRSDLRNAVMSLGRAKDPDAARAWIVKRARELKAVDALPASWDVEALTAAARSIRYPAGVQDASSRMLEAERMNRVANYDESKHPRHPKGSPQGGEFAPKGTSKLAPRPDEARAAVEHRLTRGGKLVRGPGGKLMSRTELARRLDQQEGRPLSQQHMVSGDVPLAEQEMWEEIAKNDPGRTGWKSFGYGDKVAVKDYPGMRIQSPPLHGEVVGQGKKKGTLRVKLDNGGHTETYPENLVMTKSASFTSPGEVVNTPVGKVPKVSPTALDDYLKSR